MSDIDITARKLGNYYDLNIYSGDDLVVTVTLTEGQAKRLSDDLHRQVYPPRHMLQEQE